MSRSRRKHPFCGITTARSEKQDKVLKHRSLRAAVRTALAAGRDMPTQKRSYLSKDGKQRFDSETYPEGWRKWR